MADVAEGGARPEEIAAFTAQLVAVATQIQELLQLSGLRRARPSDVRQRLHGAALLLEHWLRELRRRPDARHRRVGHPRRSHCPRDSRPDVPELQQDEERRVAAASSRFYEVAHITDLLSILIFGLHTGCDCSRLWSVAAPVSWIAPIKAKGRVDRSRQPRATNPSPRNDELTGLAAAFNEMTQNLLRLAPSSRRRINRKRPHCAIPRN